MRSICSPQQACRHNLARTSVPLVAEVCGSSSSICSLNRNLAKAGLLDPALLNLGPEPMQRFDVLIVGLGPVGAILASLCARSGLSVKVIERDHEVYKQPRAIVLDHEVVRQLNLIDCAEDVLAHSTPGEGYEFLNAERKVLTARGGPPSKMPTGYWPANLFHQPSMERIVRSKLEKLPNVDISLGVEFLGIEQDETGVTTIVRDQNGDLKELKSNFTIGCDGGRSLVRRNLDVQMEDLDFNEPWVVVDVKLLTDDTGLSKNGVQLCDPARPTTCVPSGPGRHRWEFMLKPNETADEVTRPETLKEWISAWTDPEKIELERSAVYRFHGLVAKKWRDGRIMIIGDAAHQMPPFMGQGLCAGARDAFNVAWKLVAVSNGEAPMTFLDTVEQERSPHVKEVTRGAIAMGKTVCVTDPEEARLRDKKMMDDHAAGRGFAFPGVPRIEAGVLEDQTAGAVFPEPMVGDPADPNRLDDLVGYVPLLVLADSKSLLSASPDALQALRQHRTPMAIAKLAGNDTDIVQLLDSQGFLAGLMGDAEAMIVKPDRIIFGSGNVDHVLRHWHDYLGQSSSCKPRKAG
ncbi:MAG: bifunctional 3-(3-hydroxy-phenyl)propionate/3-hydroxycinnamic acid hydroxylase [Pseudomonadota bacterium]